MGVNAFNELYRDMYGERKRQMSNFSKYKYLKKYMDPTMGNLAAKPRKSNYVPRALTRAGRHGEITNIYNPATNVGTIYNSNLLHSIVKGTDLGDRLGDKIFVKGLNLRFSIHNPNSAAADVGRLRIFVMNNKRPGTLQTTNTFATQSEAQTPMNFIGTGDFTQIIKKFNPLKFKIYMDTVVPLKIVSDQDVGPKDTYINKYVKINRYVTFNNELLGDDRVLPDITLDWFVERDDGGASFTSDIVVHCIATTFFVDI